MKTENEFRAGFADSERDATGIQDDPSKAQGSESLEAELNEIEERANAATQGPWDTETISNDGHYGSGPNVREGFDSYMILDPGGNVLFDTLNSTAITVEEDADEDGLHAWDEVGRKDSDFIAHARSDIPRLIELLRATPPLEQPGEYDRGFEAVVELIADFDDWVWCECSECKVDARSHAVNLVASMAELVSQVRALKVSLASPQPGSQEIKS